MNRVAAFVALAFIFIPPSELWFYPVELGAGFGVFILAYGLAGAAPLSLAAWAGRLDWRAMALAGAMMGLLVEGVVVTELYAALPFTLLWTSLAWHGVVSWMLGFWAMQRALRISARATAGLAATFGLGLGIWGAWMWRVREAADGTATFMDVPIAEYALQIWIGWAFFAIGHLLWSRFGHSAFVRLSKWEVSTLWGLLAIAWTINAAVPFFPLSLTLPVGCLLLAWPLRDHRAPADLGQGPPWPPARLAWTTLLPTLATLTFAVCQAAELSWEVNALAVSFLSLTAISLLLAAVPLRPQP